MPKFLSSVGWNTYETVYFLYQPISVEVDDKIIRMGKFFDPITILNKDKFIIAILDQIIQNNEYYSFNQAINEFKKYNLCYDLEYDIVTYDLLKQLEVCYKYWKEK